LYPTFKVGHIWAGPDSTKDYNELRVFNKNTFSYSPGIIAEIKISSPVY
jgi:hypothetical protein